MDATFNCNLSGPHIHPSAFLGYTVGSDHAPIALRADWQDQVETLSR